MAQRATNQQDGPKSHIHPQTKMAQGATDQRHEHKTKLREEGPSPPMPPQDAIFHFTSSHIFPEGGWTTRAQ